MPSRGSGAMGSTSNVRGHTLLTSSSSPPAVGVPAAAVAEGKWSSFLSASSSALFLLTVVTLFALLEQHDVVCFAAAQWDYSSIAAWPTAYPQCAGNAQSPIHVHTLLARPKRGAPVVLSSGCDFIAGQIVTIKDFRTTFGVAPPAGVKCNMTLKGPLIGLPLEPTVTYTLEQMHFHTDSEHAVEGQYTSMGTHWVFRRAGTAASTTATGGEEAPQDALAVLAILLATNYVDIPASAPRSFAEGVIPQFLALATKIRNRTTTATTTTTTTARPATTSATLPAATTTAAAKDTQGDEGAGAASAPYRLLANHTLSKWITSQSYFTYAGSLTTPPCTEGVRWVVIKNPVPVRPTMEFELEDALRMRDDRFDLSGGNKRPLQPLNGREVMYVVVHNDVDATVDAAEKAHNGHIVLIVMLICSVLSIGALYARSKFESWEEKRLLRKQAEQTTVQY